jgi:glycosyltransferase involved in cell wall biosynthesis
MGLALSIVIPTFNRAATLRQSLQQLIPQADALGDDVEMIVVDDGSTDDTAKVVSSLAHEGRLSIRYVHQPNRGPAAARNLGMHTARAEHILFLGDDIFPQPGLLEAHLNAYAHQEPRPTFAVLGLVIWDPSLEITPFMKWWGDQRLRFPASRKPGFTDSWRFYTCNVSAQREFLLADGGFDEEFPNAAFEDTELAFRLSKRGLELYFEPRALAYHHHPTDIGAAYRQMETAGRSFQYFHHKTGYPGLPRNWRLIGSGPWMTRGIIRRAFALAERWQDRFACPPLWISILTYSFMVGRGSRPAL